MNPNFYNSIIKTLHNRTPHVIQSGQGAYLVIDGKRKLNLCSSHYLGFAVNKRIIDAVKNAIDAYGIGTGYRTLAGTHLLHTTLEKSISNFKHAEDTVVLSGGYMANCAAIQTLLGKEDIVISDELNHASIIDAIRLSQVKNKFVYKHLDMLDLETKLQDAAKISETPKKNGEKPLKLLVTDGVFSMDGDLAPLPKIVELAEKYDVITMVDDAHGEGVLGQNGRGIVDHFRLHGQIDIEVGTLSKAFSVMGGFISGKKELIKFYKEKSRQFLFSNALTIPDITAALEGFKILTESDDVVKKLWENTEYLKSSLIKLGFDIGNSQTPITPVMLGNEDLTKTFSTKLFDNDVFATPILYPMVAKGKARIRLIPSASHSKEDLSKAVSIIAKIGSQLKII